MRTRGQQGGRGVGVGVLRGRRDKMRERVWARRTQCAEDRGEGSDSYRRAKRRMVRQTQRGNAPATILQDKTADNDNKGRQPLWEDAHCRKATEPITMRNGRFRILDWMRRCFCLEPVKAMLEAREFVLVGGEVEWLHAP